ncbi:thioredoxin-like protein [Aaosphaeria arxii CBS 175.79]|uniref:Thioredoxin-like protein n=1 Tax=Aaosphaeria arxii CBS 175.79 TaxID=1450172 RepID=A0A6A5Y1G9_9PLEO|nr:thioredoxin-like protein [Aaosphaeria arxii CBS 175.79]KAF2019405.1 thioredoxin-like protein [Aaosphaeria arxii CBS 175.79]
MRSLLYTLLSLATIATVSAADTSGSESTDNWEADTIPDTIFNGQTVPPMKELTPTTVKQELANGNWLLEFFSPHCPHCTRFKPTWQTLYEFYYTSKTIASKDQSEGDSLNSFTRYYDFKFAKLDCLAYRDTCEEYDIQSYPQVIHFKDGKEIKREKGAQDLADLSKWVEEILEAERPGSRTQGGPKLPKVGASSVETGPAKEEEAKKAQSSVQVAAQSSATKSTPTPAAKVESTKPKLNLNPSGISEPLTAQSFQNLVTNTLDPWFVKFYAPWCHHCQALQPNWAQMARQMQGKLNVGEVNCDIEKRLCKDARVKGYPTLLFFRGGERVEYNGLRGVGDLVDYAKNAVDVGSGVVDVDLKAFEKMEETEEVIFVYFYDHATTSEDFMALERLTLSLIGHAKLVKTDDAEMAKRFKVSRWPRLVVSRDGKASYYSALAPQDMRDSRKVLNWMKSVWLPIVPELTSSNAREIMDGKLVVLGILNREHSDEFANAKREIKNAALEWIEKQEHLYQLERQELRDAKQLRIEEAEDRDDQRALRNAKAIRIDMDEIERKSIGFAWVDGVFWERWIQTTFGANVKEGEKVIINDEDNKRYWDTTVTGEPIRVSRSAILETISKVASSPPKIPSKSTTGSISRFFFRLRGFVSGHPWLALGVVVGLVLGGSMFGRNRMRRRAFGNTGNYFTLDEKHGHGLLGVNGVGKKD